MAQMLFLYSPFGVPHSLVIQDYLNKGRRAKRIPSPAGSPGSPTVLFFCWVKWDNILTTENLIGGRTLERRKKCLPYPILRVFLSFPGNIHMFSNVTDDTHYYRRRHRHEKIQTRKEEEEDKPQVRREDRTAAHNTCTKWPFWYLIMC